MPRTKATKTALVPAAARLPEVLSPEEADLSGPAIDNFVQEIGGRETFTEVLAIAESAPEVERLVQLLHDPKFEHASLRRICKLAGLTVADLFRAYKKALVVRAHLQATRAIAAKLPPIVEDVMARALPTAIPCPACGNDKATRKTCPICHGTGATLSEPDLDRQKLALELGQLTERRGGGLFIQQNQQVVSAQALSAPGSGALAQLQQAVGDLLYNPSRRRRMAPTAAHETPIGDPEPFPTPSPELPDPPPDSEPEPEPLRS